MKVLMLLSVFAFLVSSSAQGQSGRLVTGTWTVHTSMAGSESEMTCAFVQKDKMLTGSCKSEQGKNEITGSVEGSKVAWSFKSDYNGAPLTIKFAGVLASDKITGESTVDEFGVNGDFTAVPATAPAAK